MTLSDRLWSWGIGRGAKRFPGAITIMRLARAVEGIERALLGNGKGRGP